MFNKSASNSTNLTVCELQLKKPLRTVLEPSFVYHKFVVYVPEEVSKDH